MIKNYDQYLKEFWTERRRVNLHENLDILRGPSAVELMDSFKDSLFVQKDSCVELTVIDGKNGEIPALCNIQGIEKLTYENGFNFILKIKFTMVREKKNGQLHRKGFRYDIFDDAEVIEAEAIYITDLNRGYITNTAVLE